MKKQEESAGNVRDLICLWILLERGQQALARVFRERWQLLKRGDWTPESARAFFSSSKGEGWPAFEKARPDQRVHLLGGTTDRWDISLLSLVLQHLPPRRRSKQQNQAIDALRRARNELIHIPAPSQLPAQKARDLQQRIMASLVALGEDKAELDCLISKQRGVTGLGGAGVAQPQASEEVLTKAAHLKGEANKKHRAEEAIKLYTKAMELPLLPKEQAPDKLNELVTGLRLAVLLYQLAATLR